MCPVPSAPLCSVVIWCQRFSVIASLLVTAGGKKWVFVDEVILIFDWDLLSVIVIQCRKCCQWMSGEKLDAGQQEIKNTELLSWSCCIWYCLWGSVECTCFILVGISVSLKTCILKVLLLFLASAYICKLNVHRNGALPLIQFLSCKASPLNCSGNGLMYNLQCEEAGSETGGWSINTDRQFEHILLGLTASTLCT